MSVSQTGTLNVTELTCRSPLWFPRGLSSLLKLRKPVFSYLISFRWSLYTQSCSTCELHSLLHRVVKRLIAFYLLNVDLSLGEKNDLVYENHVNLYLWDPFNFQELKKKKNSGIISSLWGGVGRAKRENGYFLNIYLLCSHISSQGPLGLEGVVTLQMCQATCPRSLG